MAADEVETKSVSLTSFEVLNNHEWPRHNDLEKRNTLHPSFSTNNRSSRLSLPSIWNNNNNTDLTTVSSTSSSSSTSSLWSYSLGHLPSSPTSINEDLSLNQQQNLIQDQNLQQQQRRFSIDHNNLNDLQHPLRTIWSNSSSIMDQQDTSHQRRSSLSDYSNTDNWSTLMNNGLQFNSDNAYNFGRRHSVAGPVLNYQLKVINEADNLSLNSNVSQHQQRLYLNKGILEHIDEYFGSQNGNRSSKINSSIPYTNNNINNNHNNINSLNNKYLIHENSNNNNDSSYLTSSYMETNGYCKTMTAGGEAAAFGGSTVLMGKGIPLHHFLDSNTQLYIIEFKASRTEICYIMQGDDIHPVIGDLVIVEADRGRDLGKVANLLTANEIVAKQKQRQLQDQQNNLNNNNNMDDDHLSSSSSSSNNNMMMIDSNTNNNNSNNMSSNKCQVKRLFRLADTLEITTLNTKNSDEEKALLVCQSKVQQRDLPMQVVNSEYQWDRRKLTFYFLADQRIDFRELVRELFKIYKTRIWMCALKTSTNELLPE